MNVWNNHTLDHRREPYASPIQKYNHGIIQHGSRALFPVSTEPFLAPLAPGDPEGLSEDDIAAYGIDWDDALNQTYLQHHRNNPRHAQDSLENPYVSNIPERLSHVATEDARCPYTHQASTDRLSDFISTRPYLDRCIISDRHALTQLWVDGLDFAKCLMDEELQ